LKEDSEGSRRESSGPSGWFRREEMEFKRAGGAGFDDDMMGGSWLEPCSNVVGMEGESVDDTVSAMDRFFGLPDGVANGPCCGGVDRGGNCELADWLEALILSGSSSRGGGGWCGSDIDVEP